MAFKPDLAPGQINDRVLAGLTPPRLPYYGAMAILGGLSAFAFVLWAYQVRTGMGVAGLNSPVGWGVYIANYVFWIGMAQAGTVTSAILYVVRSRWRTAIARSAEAVTIATVIIAAIFPMIHLGRFWVIYYLIPYPSQREIWPNFISPLVWDFAAVLSYFTVSSLFFFVGLLPDLAAARDHFCQKLGPDHLRTRVYRRLALGWTGAASQWVHYGRTYLFLAAMAIPLVASVHSVVSWDFAMALLPGWHTTIFAPYFVAGAILSGLGMALTLMIPMRKIMGLEQIVTVDHLEAIAKLIIITAAIMGYSYAMEPFTSWFSGDIFEWQFTVWRATGPIAGIFWLLIPCNVIFPLLFAFKRVRRNIPALFVISLFINVGMWLERYMLTVASTAHDFMPHNWGPYLPSWVEVFITVGSFAFLLFLFMAFAKVLPTVAISEVKSLVTGQKDKEGQYAPPGARRAKIARGGLPAVVGVYGSAEDALKAIGRLREMPFGRFEMFSPERVDGANQALGLSRGPVRLWTLAGGVTGLCGAFILAIGSALANDLIVGGKHPIAIIPYCVVGFEATVLLGAIFSVTGMILHSRLGFPETHPAYSPEFSRDKYGVVVECPQERMDYVRQVMEETKPEQMRTVGFDRVSA